MKTKSNDAFIVAMSSMLLIFFTIAIILMVQESSTGFAYDILLAQLVAFLIASLATTIYYANSLLSQPSHTGSGITKIVMLSETNAHQDEVSLINNTSVMLCKGDEVYFSFHEARFPTEEYALLNRANNAWYIERSSENRSVGIKRAGEQYVYKLKTGMTYKISRNDIIYIGGERLVAL